MREVLEGHGKLENWEHPEKQHEVDYSFEIMTDILERPGFPRAVVQRHSTGSVARMDGEAFPEGEYRLYGQDGEMIKLKNLGMTWTILAT